MNRVTEYLNILGHLVEHDILNNESLPQTPFSCPPWNPMPHLATHQRREHNPMHLRSHLSPLTSRIWSIILCLGWYIYPTHHHFQRDPFSCHSEFSHRSPSSSASWQVTEALGWCSVYQSKWYQRTQWTGWANGWDLFHGKPGSGLVGWEFRWEWWGVCFDVKNCNWEWKWAYGWYVSKCVLVLFSTHRERMVYSSLDNTRAGASESGSSCWLWICLDNLECLAEGMATSRNDWVYKDGNGHEEGRGREQ